MRYQWLMTLVLVTGCVNIPRDEVPPAPRELGQELEPLRVPVNPNQAFKRPTKVEPTGDLSMSEALSLALLHNPQLEAYAWHWRGQEAAILQSQLRPNPVLGLKVENFGGQDALEGFDGAMSTLRISQAIELGDKRMKRARLAQRQYALAAWDYESQRLHTIGQTGQRFIKVLAAQEKVTLAEQSLALAQHLYNIVEDRVNQGVIPAVERDKARVQLATRQIDLDKQHHQLATLQQQLASQWASDQVTFQTLSGTLMELHPLPAYEDLIDRIAENPDLARWATEMTARQAAIEVADAGAIPNLTVGAGVRRFNLTDDHAFVFELGIPLPLVHRNQGAKRQSRFQLQQAKAQQRQAEIQARTILHQLYQSLSAHHYAATQFTEHSLPAAQRAYQSAQDRFSQGITDYLNVLDAERTLVTTHDQTVDAYADYRRTLIQIEAYIGTSLITEKR